MMILLTALACFAVAITPDQTVPLSELHPKRATQSWGDLGIDASAEGRPLRIGQRKFSHGLGTHADSEITFALKSGVKRFQAWVGIDAEVEKYRNLPQWKAGVHPSVVFQVLTDGKLAFDSGTMLVETPAKRVDIPLQGVNTLKLVVASAGDGNFCDHADWAEPVLIGAAIKATPPGGARAFTVSSPGLSVDLTRQGAICGLRMGGKSIAAQAFSDPAGLETVGGVAARRLAGNGREFTKKLARGGLLKERFVPTADSVRWTLELTTPGKPWSEPIDTTLLWPNKNAKIWTAWGNEYEWSDPLIPKPFGRMDLDYGAFYARKNGISLPLVTVLDGKTGFSMIQSPEDNVIQMQLQADKNGRIALSRAAQRLGEGRTWRFSVDLVAHAADPRSGMAWIVKHYPELFDPPIPLADEVGGGGVYSGYEGDQDAAKLRRMGFTFNWKASIDFPYMGMFLPPIPKDQKWNRFAGGGGGSYTEADQGRYGTTSIDQLEDYARRTRKAGFHVLSYFNVTEFGGNIVYPPPARTIQDNKDLWKNANDFLYASFPAAIVRYPDRPIWTWGSAVIMDCGDKRYQDFLVRQAERNIKELPDTSGICIDRMDWLILLNSHADDGVSWADGPVRSLYKSWDKLMARMGPMMHKANKVIYVNAMVRRPDLMRHIDGVYDEHGDFGYNLNTSSWICLRKPLVCWTRNEAELRPDPDNFVQRHLYMGAFMTVPVPGNDHTVLPSAWANRLYSDYGPMFNALRGRKWVLLPNVVSTSVGKANVFQTKQGYMAPVVFGGKATQAKLTLRGLPKTARAAVLHPGETAWKPLSARRTRGSLSLDVPLQRGCALVRVS